METLFPVFALSRDSPAMFWNDALSKLIVPVSDWPTTELFDTVLVFCARTSMAVSAFPVTFARSSPAIRSPAPKGDGASWALACAAINSAKAAATACLLFPDFIDLLPTCTREGGASGSRPLTPKDYWPRFSAPVETLTFTAEFCDAAAPVFMLSDCRPAKLVKAPSPVDTLLSMFPLGLPDGMA